MNNVCVCVYVCLCACASACLCARAYASACQRVRVRVRVCVCAWVDARRVCVCEHAYECALVILLTILLFTEKTVLAAAECSLRRKHFFYTAISISPVFIVLSRPRFFPPFFPMRFFFTFGGFLLIYWLFFIPSITLLFSKKGLTIFNYFFCEIGRWSVRVAEPRDGVECGCGPSNLQLDV